MEVERTHFSGCFLEGEYVAKKFYIGTTVPYTVYIPELCKGKTECALLVQHDGFNEGEALAMEQLGMTEEVPPCIIICTSGGCLHPTLETGKDRGMRMAQYDMFSGEYPAFMVEELIPWLVETYGLSLSDSPDMHMVSGGSSGGVSAWNMAWYQTDYFHRVYMSSASFLSMGRGRELSALIRKVETKPIRVFADYSEEEPDDYFGSSFCAADDVERSLRFAGYEMMTQYHPLEGHCSRRCSYEDALERMRFLWKDWQTEPVKVKKLSPRTEQLISLEFPWEETQEPFPTKEVAVSNGALSAAGIYVADGENVYFVSEDGVEQKVADGMGNISSLAISSDRWRLYIGSLDRGCVYATNICPNGTLTGRYLHSALHMETDFQHPGIFDLCVDSKDRIFAATELGIQCIRSFGLIDVILPLPGSSVPQKIAFGGKDMDYLYVKSGNKIFRRKMKTSAKQNPQSITEPQYIGYYD